MIEEPEVTPLAPFAGVAGRISLVKEYRGAPDRMRGLCPSCLNSGFVHVTRHSPVYDREVTGVLMDYRGVIVRCDCEEGRKITARDAEGRAR